MDSFDFNSLCPEDLDQTLSYLNAPPFSPMPLPALGSFEPFSDAEMQPQLDDSATWLPLANTDGGLAIPTFLTDAFPVAAAQAGVGWAGLNQSSQPQPPLIMSSGFPSVFEVQQTDPEMNLSCDWPSCNSQRVYASFRDVQNHKTDVHVAHVLSTWPSHCSWPGCTCKAIFKTGRRLESHVYNIHVTPLYCNVDGCTHKKPFERQADLDRHFVSRHTKERKYKCLHRKCYYSFSRKDKFKLHQKIYHELFNCSYAHCEKGCPSEAALQSHQASHSWYDFECALGSCADTSSSKFYYFELQNHIVDEHKVHSDLSRDLKLGFPYGPGRTITMADFPAGIPGFQDCEECKKKLKEAKSDDNAANTK